MKIHPTEIETDPERRDFLRALRKRNVARLHTLLASVLAAGGFACSASAAEIAVTVNTDVVANKIDPLVYGHFYEHIYHSANNGLWGEVVWNRSFEQDRDNAMGSVGWVSEGNVVSYNGTEAQSRITGAFEYRDFDFSIQIRKESDAGAVRLLFRGNTSLTLGAQSNAVHVIENLPMRGRGPGGEAQGTILAGPVSGSIAAGEWHNVRVRMEDRAIQAWLNGKMIFDVKPATNEPVRVRNAGWLGIGVAGTKAQFRNFMVKGLDGTVFWNRPFPANVPNTIVERWGVIGGEARVIRQAGEALNDERCLELVGNERTVLSQPDFYLKRNDPLEGSLWLKGTVDGGVTVQFVNGETIVAEQKLGAPSAEWTEFPLRLTSRREVDAATLRIIFNGPHRVRIDQVSLMPRSSRDNGGFRPDLFEAFRGLQPTTLRWPGGCFAETYRWKHGIGPQKDRKKGLQPWWEEFDPNALGTDEYIRLSRMLNSEPLIVVQTGMHQVKPGGNRQDNDPIDTPEEWEPFIVEACEWIEYCNGPATSKWGAVRAANGHPEPYNVKLWEIDNELWRSRVRSPEVYSRAVNLFSRRMKETDPSITIIAHGGNGTDRRYNIPVVTNAAENFSVLSIHHYTSAEGFVTGIADQDRLYTDVRELIAGSKNPDIQVYVSEWNAQTTDWRTGVYAGGILNVFEKHGAYLTMAGPALLGRHISAHGWDNAFINFDQKGWFPGPNYVVMKLWREHFAPVRLQSKTADEAALNLVATRSEDSNEVILKAVNLKDEPVDVTVRLDGGFKARRAAMKLIAPRSTQARNSMAAKDHIKPVNGRARVDRNNTVRFTLAPYAVGAVRLTK